MGAIVCSELIERYPEFNEGQLSKFKCALVNEESLARLARFMGLGTLLILGKGEAKSNGIDKDALLSDAFESLLGAIYIDGGYAKVYKSFITLIDSYQKESRIDFFNLARCELYDPKTSLQEKTMALYGCTPEYNSCELTNMLFSVELVINGASILKMEDVSKKKAQKKLAKCALEKELYARGFHCYLLDGDNIRAGLCSNLRFTAEDRRENIRRISETSKLFIDAGVICINAFVSPTIEIRQMAKDIIGEEHFIEVYVNTPLEVCEARDVKGLYKKARAGEIKNFTGIDAPYEALLYPQIEIKTVAQSIEEACQLIINQSFNQ